jgi:pre-mRNA-splicing factor CWC26
VRSKSRRRYDSDDDEQPKDQKPKRRYDSDENEQKPNIGNDSREKMSSGHSAGLQQAGHFSIAEQGIQKQRRKEAQAMVDRHGMGETIYRDEAGRKVDASQIKPKKSIPQLSEKQQAELNKGRVQKQQEHAHQREWQEIKESSFARYQDDAGLEDARRDVIREGDPMALHAAKTSAKVRAESGRPQRPVYKGPAPKPNRYGIRPGYRWDGVDRGNGFEDKVLASQYSAKHKKEQAYRWSSADM